MDLTNWINSEENVEEKKEVDLKVKPEPKENPNVIEPKVEDAKDSKEIDKPISQPKQNKKEPELPWSEKYRPNTLDEVVGNPQSIQSVRKWADMWLKKYPKKKAMLLHGRVGIGKTTICYCLANDYDWEVLEMNASDKRSQDLVNQIAGLGSQTRTFSGKRRILVIEEIDGLSGMADRGAAKALIEVIKNTKTPIVLTCNDAKNKKLGSLKRYCEEVPLKKIASGQIVKRLGDILEHEGIGIESIEVLQKIADNCDGDMRSAVNDLQALGDGEKIVTLDSVFLEQRDRPIDVYKAMQRIFRCNDYKACRRVLWDLDEEPRNFIAWLDENIPREYKKPSEIAKAFNNLSRADMFLGRVTNRQYWGFLRYVNDLMSVGVGFSKEGPNFEFTQYKFPSLIWKMGSSRGRRAKEKSISEKISPIVHESTHSLISDYLPLIKKVFDKNTEAGIEMISAYGLEEDEVDFLCK